MSKTKLQLIDERTALLKVNQDMLTEGKDGYRDLSEDDQKTWDTNIRAIEELDIQIKRVEALEDAKNRTYRHVDPVTPKEKFSFLRTLRNLANGAQMHTADAALVEQGREDFVRNGITPEGSITLPLVDHLHPKRADILAGTANQGAEIVSTDHLNILGPLRNALVFTKVGATYLTGLVGNIDIPKYAGSTAAWKGEVAAATDAAGAHSDISLTPMRITGYLDISKRYLIQDAVGAEELLKSDLVAAISGLLESTALGLTAASAGVNPAGLLPVANTTYEGAAVAWSNAVDLEAAVDASNALDSNLAYITHPSLRGEMKQTARIASTDSRMIMEGNDLNGYPIHTTANMNTNLGTDGDEYGLAFANWRHLLIAQWGGIDLLVDPYSLGTTAQVRIVVNSYWDFAFRYSGALAFGSSPIA